METHKRIFSKYDYFEVRKSCQGLPLFFLAPRIKDLATPLHEIKPVTSRTHITIHTEAEFYKITISITKSGLHAFCFLKCSNTGHYT